MRESWHLPTTISKASHLAHFRERHSEHRGGLDGARTVGRLGVTTQAIIENLSRYAPHREDDREKATGTDRPPKAPCPCRVRHATERF